MALPSTDLRFLVALALACSLASVGPVRAQEREAWNDGRVLDLVARARELRASTTADSTLNSYRADARGFVYFFIDRADSDERTLVKTDQIALEVYWQAPDRTKQRIVGLRDEKVFPTQIRYHLDHLTVVQDDFDDFIRLGDGDEVSAVLHPVAPRGEETYDFLLSDSLTLRYGAAGEEVRVYELRVRPKAPDAPGFIGSVYIDRGTAAIVRMSFTFTPSSYVDPYLDYIRISIDNSLWMGRHWLPYRQEAELRRELPQLDLLAGSIIRGRFEIGGYEFNPDLPPGLFLGAAVTSVPEAEREAFAFERALYDDLEAEGLAPAPNLEEIRLQAREVIAGRALSGLAPWRLHFRSFSDALRYDRAEGVFIGAGVHLRLDPLALFRLSGGYGFGRGAFSWTVSATGTTDPVVPVLEAYFDELRDVGGAVGSEAAVIRSLAAAITREDYLDPFFARGARLTLRGAYPDQRPSLTLRWERHRSARNVLGEDFRAVRPIEPGVLGAADLRVPFGLPGRGAGDVTGTVGRISDGTYVSALGNAQWTKGAADRTWSVRLDAAVGASAGSVPVQSLFLLGGRGTLPGHDYRGWGGKRFWLLKVEGTRPLVGRWLGVRAFGAASAIWALPDHIPPDWGVAESGGARGSVGAGLSLAWDVLRLDVARGVGGGSWELIFSVDPRFEPWL